MNDQPPLRPWCWGLYLVLLILQSAAPVAGQSRWVAAQSLFSRSATTASRSAMRPTNPPPAQDYFRAAQTMPWAPPNAANGPSPAGAATRGPWPTPASETRGTREGATFRPVTYQNPSDTSLPAVDPLTLDPPAWIAETDPSANDPATWADNPTAGNRERIAALPNPRAPAPLRFAPATMPNPAAPAAASQPVTFQPPGLQPTAPQPTAPQPVAVAPLAVGPNPPPALTADGLAGNLGSTTYLLAEQPKADGRFQYAPPLMSPGAAQVDYSHYDFSPDPICWDHYDSSAQQNVYEGKSLNRNQRPIVEWFKPWYQRGQLRPGNTLLGTHNPLIPQFLVYGDYRTGWASNTANGNNFSVWAHRLNLDFDLRLTSTERIHWFMTPLNRGPNFTRLINDGDPTFVSELNPDVLFGFFEGDLGAIWGGLTNQTLPFDLPVALGVMPLLFQNGVWLEDAFLGVAATIPARNSPLLDISNMDTTFFAGFDNISSPAFNNENSAARMYGVATFIEAWGGYVEMNYAYLQDRRELDRGYHNSSVAYTRRFGTWLSHSTRVINNAGQDPNGIEQTADGTLLLWENSLITNYPSTRIPYFNFFAGFDRPQSAARDPLAGGVLRNTGILFETDGLTGYPFLDDTANNTLGGAVGLNLLADDFSQQLVLETAAVLPFQDKVSQAGDPQYGFGLRYQIPLNNSVILRSDAMYGIQESGNDLQGVRVELRKKW